jgi:hypothetical protein
MKFQFVAIFLTFTQLSLRAQQSEWSKDVVKKNKIKTVLVYQRVPDTNPAYYGNPKGMMLMSETNFDTDGKIIHSVEKDAEVRSDTQPNEPSSADFIQDFIYKGERLIKIYEQGFDKYEISYLYDTINFKRLAFKSNKKNERIYTGLESFDNSWREISSIDINFEHIWEHGDSIIQVFFTKSVSEYARTKKMEKVFHYGFGKNIHKKIYEVFKRSSDFNKIQEAFQGIDLSFLQSLGRNITFYDRNGNELKTEDEATHTPYSIYTRSKNGLIIQKEVRFPLYTFIHEYQYVFWK